MGADYIIAVDVGTPLRPRSELSGAISILFQSFSLAGKKKEKENLELADIGIRPNLQNFSTVDFNKKKIEVMIERGRQAVYPHLDSLLKLNRIPSFIVSSISTPSFNRGILYGITISGNTTLPFSFIYQNLGLKPGETFTAGLLENRMNHLYSLGYFQTVNYRLENTERNLYRLHVFVKERAGSFLRLGFRYQNDFKGILGVNLKIKDFPYPGILNEISYLFSGLQLFEWEFSYPRRAFGSRIYPYFLGFYQDIPIYIYNNRERIASYRNSSYGGSIGLGLILFNWGEIRTEYMLEKLQVTPSIALTEIYSWPKWEYNVHMGRIYMNIDLLDNPLTPRHGYQAHVELNRTLNLFRQRENFTRFYTWHEFYGTVIRRNTSSIHIFMGFSKNVQIYRYYYLNQPFTFIGYHNDEFAGANLATYRIENRFHWTTMISLVGVFNAGQIWDDFYRIDFRDRPITGYGFGFQVNTFLGPFRYLIGFSGDRTVQYITFGFSLKTRTGSRR
jgi:outer membrane protein assembly factor BamA